MTTRLLDLFQAAPQPGPGGGLIQFLPMIFIFVVFYFLLIAPMRKKQKRQQQMLSQLKRGDEVVTASGILGRIAALDDANGIRSEEHTSELQSQSNLVCRLLLEKKK